MASWIVFEAAEPEMAAAGRRLLWVPGIGFGYREFPPTYHRWRASAPS